MIYILIFLIIIYLIITYLMFILICKRIKYSPLSFIDRNIDESLKPFKKIIDKGNDWFSKIKYKDIYIKSNDGLKLHGIFIENYKSKGILIETHGYRSSVQRDLLASCYHYFEMGYSLLLVDQRANGMSEGKYITFGMKESEDIISWIKYINKKYKNLPISLGAISMGASSIMMAMKDIKDNMNVKSVIADCGYNNAYDEVNYCIKHYFHIPGKLFIDMINIWCRLIAKFNLKDKTVIDCIKNSNIPLLIIHGKEDDFVPTINSKLIYDAYKSKKEILIVKNANHGTSYLVDSDKYIKTIKKFL